MSQDRKTYMKIYMASYRQKWLAEHPGYNAKKAREWEASHPGYHTAYMRKWRGSKSTKSKVRQPRSVYRARYRASKPDQTKARAAVYYAIRSGKLSRPDRCSNCQKKCRPEAHHHRGYEKAFHLDIVWLCRKCHLDVC